MIYDKKKFEENIKAQQDEVAKAVGALASTDHAKIAVTDRKGMLDLIKMVSAKLDAIIKAEFSTRVIIAEQYDFSDPSFKEEYNKVIRTILKDSMVFTGPVLFNNQNQ